MVEHRILIIFFEVFISYFHLNCESHVCACKTNTTYYLEIFLNIQHKQSKQLVKQKELLKKLITIRGKNTASILITHYKNVQRNVKSLCKSSSFIYLFLVNMYISWG